MAEFQYKAGLHSVGNFQVSAIPYATSSLLAPANTAAPLEIVFPSVTKFVVVKNIHPSTAAMKVGFSANGVSGSTNYIVLNKDETLCGDFKLTSVFIQSMNGTPVSASVMAGLTGITGYNLTAVYSGSQGVG